MKVRETRDFSLIAQLDKQCFPLDEPYKFTVAKWWVIEENGEIMAYAGARYWPPDNAVFLCRAGVLPKYRGKNLQKKLIRIRKKWAKKIGASCAYTYTLPTNAISARNLVKCGFLPWNPGVAWAGPEFCYWLWNVK